MKYGALLKILRVLIYIKRFFWWIGAQASFILAKIFGSIGRFFIFVQYKTAYLIKKTGITQSREWFFKRGVLQIVLFSAVLGLVMSQTTTVSKKNLALAGQKTIAYDLMDAGEEYGAEEVFSETQVVPEQPSMWKIGLVENQYGPEGEAQSETHANEIAGIVAGGSALNKPIIVPGATVGSTRDSIVEYAVEPGDSLGGIAYQYGVSVATVLWENGLTTRSIIKPGDVLKIPPTSGIMHTVKSGDSVLKIAKLYGAEPSEILAFNHLKDDGSDLIKGERIMVPNGVKPAEQGLAVGPRVVKRNQPLNSVVSIKGLPPVSMDHPSASGYIWPSGSHTITQYFSLKHSGVDIAGPWQTATYAAKAGTVEKASCGWNTGYGCMIIIDHDDGLRTLYGHNSKLLVQAGDHVEQGQLISLMGNTGNVRGKTGIHLHFEIMEGKTRINPLGYIK